MLERFSRSVRLALLALAAGAVLVAVGVGGMAVASATPVPAAVGVPFELLGNLGAVLVMVGVLVIGLKLVVELA